MTREDRILKHIDQTGWGIEIGPSYNPIAPKRRGYNVHVIDYLNREQLIKKYGNFPVDTSNIEEVDFVWQGETYKELTGKERHYDWIIASHVIEHTPNLIGFLVQCDEVLKEDGVLSLAIPDKRYCFDYFRPITGVAKVIDYHLLGNKHHTPGTIFEFEASFATKNGDEVWGPELHAAAGPRAEYKLSTSFETAASSMTEAIEQNRYKDVHAWCFTPHSFRLIVRDLFALGMIPFQEVDFYPSVGCEFFVTLGRRGSEPSLSRLEMLQTMEAELQENQTTSVATQTHATTFWKTQIKRYIGKYSPFRRS